MATRSAWGTTSISATATACARRCNGRPIATADSRAPIRPRWCCRPTWTRSTVTKRSTSRRRAEIRTRCSTGCGARFGRGSLRFLYPKNRKVLAYVREYHGDTILCVANVARSSQAVELDLSEFEGRVPIELNAGSLFPPIGQLTYLLTLPPYGFYWFMLATEANHPDWHVPAPEPLPDYITIVLRGSLGDALRASAASLEREALPLYLTKRRWFSAKDQTIESTRMLYLTRLGGAGSPPRIKPSNRL